MFNSWHPLYVYTAGYQQTFWPGFQHKRSFVSSIVDHKAILLHFSKHKPDWYPPYFLPSFLANVSFLQKIQNGISGGERHRLGKKHNEGREREREGGMGVRLKIKLCEWGSTHFSRVYDQFPWRVPQPRNSFAQIWFHKFSHIISGTQVRIIFFLKINNSVGCQFIGYLFTVSDFH